MFGFKKKSKEEQFWSWFKKFEKNFVREDFEDHDAVQMVARKLAEFEEGLVCELTTAKKDLYELIISADGIKSLFPAVEKLTESAPKMNNWTIIAFRPAMENFTELGLRYSGVKFDISKIWFDFERYGDVLDLTLYFEKELNASDDILHGGGFILLDMALGEYNVATRIGNIEFLRLEQSPDSLELLPYSDISDIFNQYIERADSDVKQEILELDEHWKQKLNNYLSAVTDYISPGSESSYVGSSYVRYPHGVLQICWFVR